jgi:hypothetical protein
MKTSERICREVHELPEPLAREVLDFVWYLKDRYGFHQSSIEDLKQAQISVMQRIWDNVEDEAWDDL